MEYRPENVPFPTSKPDTFTAAMKALNVGQSFLIPDEKLGKHTRKGLYSIAQNIGVTIATRSVEEGLRVWRVDKKVTNQAEIIKDIAEVPMSRQEKLDNLRAMIADPRPFIHPEPEIADWRFTPDKPNYADDGKVYRLQKLAPAFKQTRTVGVDEDNLDIIVNIK